MTDNEWWEVIDGSGLAEPVLFGTQTAALAATLTTEVTYTQASFLIGWALQRINTGQTAPWTTTELPNDLASCTIDFAWSQFDTTTMKTKRYLGCKPGGLTLTGSRDAPKLMMTMPIIGSTPQGNPYDSSVDPTLTEPALTVFPTDVAVFQHLKGNFTIAGASRSNFENVTVTVNNTLVPYFDESRYANAIRLGSRRSTITTRFRLKSTVSDRVTYETATPQAAELTWNNGTHSIVLNYNSQNQINTYKEDIPLDREVYYAYGLAGHLDQTAGGMLTASFT